MRLRFSLRSVLIFMTAASITLAVVFSVLVPSFNQAVNNVLHQAKQRQCISNGKEMYLALAFYIDKYGQYPPRVVLGPNGKPWHSWRVLLLEAIDPTLFRQYSFDEPWDGPNNSKLLFLMPSCYRCPLDRRSNSSFTSYVFESTVDANAAYEWRVTEARHDILWMAPLDGLSKKPQPPVDCGPPTIIVDDHVDKKSFGSSEQSNGSGVID